MKFNYAPGLPGYGTRGIDGSGGTPGLSCYFTSLNGSTDQTVLALRISTNKELWGPGIDSLPDGRAYVSGDVFIDVNGKVWVIDLTRHPEKYKYTGSTLNLSGTFELATSQHEGLKFDRYINKIKDSKQLIDSVYATNANSYSEKPSGGIYDTLPVYYGKISYIDADLVESLPNPHNYYPYEVWATESDVTDNHIALVRSASENLWRLGNYNGITVGNVDLALDFVSTEFGGNLIINSPVNDVSIISRNSNMIFETTDTSITGLSGRKILFKTGSVIPGTAATYNGGNFQVDTGKGGSITSGTSYAGTGGHFIINTGGGGDASVNTYGGGKGGSFIINTGKGGNKYGTGDNKGDGGGVLFNLGDGGGGNTQSGSGGNFEVNSGDGSASLLTSGSPGGGGFVKFTAGNGGDGNMIPHSTGPYGANGGDIILQGGNGGDAYSTAGKGGNIIIKPGLSGAGGYTLSRPRGKVYLGCDTSNGDIKSGQAIMGNGTAAIPSLSFSDGKTGFYKPDIDTLGVTLGGHTFTIDGSSDIYTANILNLKSEGGLRLYSQGVDRGYNSTKDGNSLRLYGSNEGKVGGPVECFGGNGTQKGGRIRLRGGDGGNDDEDGDNPGGNIEITGGTGRTGGDILLTGGNSLSGSNNRVVKRAGKVVIKSGNDDVTDWTGNIHPDKTGIHLKGGLKRYVGAYGFGQRSADICIDVEGSTNWSGGTRSGNIILKLGDRTNNHDRGSLYIEKLESLVEENTSIDNFETLIINKETKEVKAYNGNLSDGNLKDIQNNVIDISEKLSDLNVVNFKWKETIYDEKIAEKNEATLTDTLHIGLIAQELEKVYPELVYEMTSETGYKYKNIKYNSLIPLLVGGIGELRKIVDTQQEQINELKKQVQLLLNK